MKEQKAPEPSAAFSSRPLVPTDDKVESHGASSNSDSESNHILDEKSQSTVTESGGFSDLSSLNFVAIGVGALVAVIGALLWKFIAVMFGYELGLIAWLIGGAVGFVAAVFGSKGEVSGAICAVLTLMAILGGKYMTVESYKSDWSQIISSSSEEEVQAFKYAYEQELLIADFYYREVDDEQSFRSFMVTYGYSDAYEAKDVTGEKIAHFKSDV